MRGQCRSVARPRQRQVLNYGLSAVYTYPLLLLCCGQLKSCLCRGFGLIAAATDGADWTRPGTVRGHGSAATSACLLIVRVRGFAVLVVVHDSYRVVVLRIQRDDFADAESFGTKG